MKLGMTSAVLRDDTGAEAARKIAAAGFEALELVAFHLNPAHDEDAIFRELPRVLEETGLIPWSVHLPFSNLDIGNLNEAIRKQSIRITKHSIDRAVRLGFPLGVLHPGSWGGSEREDRVVDFSKNVITSVRELAEHAGEKGFRLAVENMLGGRKPFHFGSRAEDIGRVVKEVDSPHVGICVDVGHFEYSKIPPAEGIRKLREHILTFHIQSNDGKGDLHWPPMSGPIDWPQVAAAVKEMKFEGVLMCETLRTAEGETGDIALKQSFKGLSKFRDLIRSAGS